MDFFLGSDKFFDFIDFEAVKSEDSDVLLRHNLFESRLTAISTPMVLRICESGMLF